MARTRTELLFRIAMAFKGIDGAIEQIGGVLLLTVSQIEVQKLIGAIVTHDLLGPAGGSLSRHFVAGTPRSPRATARSPWPICFCTAWSRWRS